MRLARANVDHALGTEGPFLIFVWRSHTHAQDVKLAMGVLEAVASEHPGRIHLLQVIEAAAIAPNSDARSALSALLRSGTGRVAYSSLVQEGDGFRASMVRSIVTGLALLSKPGFPHMVFDSLERALERHAQVLGVPPADPLLQRVRAAVGELRGATALGRVG